MQLTYREEFSDGLKRLIVEEGESALHYLREAETIEASHRAVHEVRKAFKKIRAALRLLRDVTPHYSSTNTFFRDQARTISELRDATATLETFGLLEQQYAEQLKPDALATIRSHLEGFRDTVAQTVFEEERRLSAIQEALSEWLADIRDWEIETVIFEDIQPNVLRVYKRGRSSMERAQRSGSTEDYHEWRKQAKYLRYQVAIMQRIWPRVMAVWESELHVLTDLTGMDQNLAVLQKVLARCAPQLLDEPFGMVLQAIIEQHRHFARTHALLLGAKFYDPQPRAFCESLGIYWNNHQREIRQPGLPGLDQLAY